MDRAVKSTQEKKSVFQKCLDGIEVVGNKLPHPITLFALFCVAIMIISAVAAGVGLSAEGELINRATNEVEFQTITAVSLLSREGIVYMLENAISNFINFAPLGVVLVGMLGIGTAEGSGYISALLKKTVSVTPAKLVTPMVVFLGVMSNIASDAGYVVLVPLAALIFMSFGRHPLAGLAAGFAGVSGGFSANLIIGTIDPMLAGISTGAAQMLDPNYTVQAASNMYFMMASTFLITGLGWFITDKIVEPRLGSFSGKSQLSEEDKNLQNLSKEEQRALKITNTVVLLMLAALVAIVLMPNSVLRNLEADTFANSIIDHSPLMNGLVVLIAIIFFVAAVVYGKLSGKFKNEKDVGAELGKSMASMGSYIALAFVMAQFVSYFSYTNLGTILALKGAELLGSMNMNSIVLIIVFVLFAGFINLFMGSASAKWAIMAPVFLPMFMKLGISPELTQVAYRIGDSTTNIISPLMSYFAMIVIFAQKHDKKAGIGTLISTMVPYSLIFLVGWIIMLVLWMTLGLPLGPGAGLVYSL
ncbi:MULTISPECIES: AbgT family transporter [unclassified Romboutsia]|uniref:AbgT family transporter n=1 Tax=unclassified Romboutsia TaxID=2626894 RepID=UPI0008206AA2|nr:MULTISPECIES: AbgT family transporter [unclassified Romboutsia]SCG97647.1 Aminobenzoyl-glutamate transport protein [uncultured Clostridium sp.]